VLGETTVGSIVVGEPLENWRRASWCAALAKFKALHGELAAIRIGRHDDRDIIEKDVEAVVRASGAPGDLFMRVDKTWWVFVAHRHLEAIYKVVEQAGALDALQIREVPNPNACGHGRCTRRATYSRLSRAGSPDAVWYAPEDYL
jgi:hypothetical protein